MLTPGYHYGVFQWPEGHHSAAIYRDGDSFAPAVWIRDCKTLGSAKATATRLDQNNGN